MIVARLVTRVLAAQSIDSSEWVKTPAGPRVELSLGALEGRWADRQRNVVVYRGAAYAQPPGRTAALAPAGGEACSLRGGCPRSFRERGCSSQRRATLTGQGCRYAHPIEPSRTLTGSWGTRSVCISICAEKPATSTSDCCGSDSA